MRFKQFSVSSLLILLILTVTVPLGSVRAQDEFPPDATATPEPISVEVVNDYYTAVTSRLADGTLLTADVINGPSEPPNHEAWEASRVAVSSLDRANNPLSGFPSYDWVYGCSAVSGAMIAGYYDNNGYPNMYAGPMNGGVMPQTDTAWPTWRDGANALYPNNPLIASHNGVDGFSGNGSIDDYWVSYLSGDDDPYIAGSWTQHDWGTAIGDFMKTSQSAYGNLDGSTSFWNYTSSTQKLTCETMNSNNLADGTLGRKKFYEARGYTVTECYNQYTDNEVEGSFSLQDYQAEIDAGHPVLINLVGHSVVGFGYNGSTIYIRDTWDNDPSVVYSMPWGGSYQNMAMLSVSIVHLEAASPDFSKLSPADQSPNLIPSSVTLSWQESFGAVDYEYCLSAGASCTNWTSTGTSTSVSPGSLVGGETYIWQVRAKDSSDVITYADGAAGETWQFTTLDMSLLTEQTFVPLILK